MFRDLGKYHCLMLVLLCIGCLLSACEKKSDNANTSSLQTQLSSDQPSVNQSNNVFDGELQDYPAPKWYHTQDYGISLVTEKKTIEIDAECALKILSELGKPIADGWQAYLPEKISDADYVSQMDDLAGRDNEIQPLQVIILGFDDKQVHVIFARMAGGFLWHSYHAVEADLKIQRSPQVDQRLNLAEFTKPFTRSIGQIQYNDTRHFTHHILGKPDASQSSQAGGLYWDYYFDRNITIEYQMHVFKITDGVPESIRKRETDDFLIHYRDKNSLPSESSAPLR